jgi:deoxyribonuclease-1
MEITKIKVILLLIYGIILAAGTNVMAESPNSFIQAKRIVTKIYAQNRQSFFCGCEYQEQDKVLLPSFDKCGYKSESKNKRVDTVEWAHVIPEKALGEQRKCWKYGGLKHCKTHDPVFKKLLTDLHNIVPAITRLNKDRSKYRFGLIDGEKRIFGQCDLEIDKKQRRVEPAPSVRGDIGRIYLYMAERYKLNLSRAQEKLFTAWDSADPVDKWECKRDLLIKSAQGNSNEFVQGEC